MLFVWVSNFIHPQLPPIERSPKHPLPVVRGTGPNATYPSEFSDTPFLCGPWSTVGNELRRFTLCKHLLANIRWLNTINFSRLLTIKMEEIGESRSAREEKPQRNLSHTSNAWVDCLDRLRRLFARQISSGRGRLPDFLVSSQRLARPRELDPGRRTHSAHRFAVGAKLAAISLHSATAIHILACERAAFSVIGIYDQSAT